LAKPEVQETLRAIWTDPLSRDPAKRSARVTREIATQLAQVAKALEAAGHEPKRVAAFLSRCLFTMFAEDIGLLPKRAFADLLERYVTDPATLSMQLETLWRAMDRGEFSPLLGKTLLHFNGKLFKQPEAIPLERQQIELLLAAAHADWKQVEPAIFGTLLERALDPEERHALGAHYTPRAYVERLVLPTIIEPLRQDWQHAQAAALVLINEGNGKAADEARRLVREYLMRLCDVRVLDPACGSGNFLYVALEQMKRLEGEVLNFLDSLGDTQGRLDLAGVSVDPHQLLGIELNPRAAEVAEMVLWIGYLQWHFRTRGNVNPPLPVLKEFHNIECRDAVLAYDRIEFETDANGKPVTRWDGKTMKSHPVTGLSVPDERAQVPVQKVVNPRAAQWPAADFVIGNPPFIGNKRMRIALGDGYVEGLRESWPNVPETADLVMYWWEHAAELTRAGKLRRFGLITTNSLRQTFNRKVIERHLTDKKPLSLVFAIPDHPWVDNADGAAVRIAMTAGAVSAESGLFLSVEREAAGEDGEAQVELLSRRGEIHADLTVGAKVGSAQRLQANAGLCFQGMNLVGKGFRLSEADVLSLGYRFDALPEVIKPHRNARDMMQGGEDCWVIDFYGYTAEKAREKHPALYQWLLDRVKPERDHNNDPQRRRDWWLFGRSNSALRAAAAGLNTFVLTPETSKHRVFELQALPFCPDHKLYAICSTDLMILGVLSSGVHARWALRAGGKLGVGNDPTWTNTTTFLPFPFPAADADRSRRIAAFAGSIEAHRRTVRLEHPDLTLTGLYNVLEKLRRGESLTAKDKTIHDHGLVSVLRELHDDLDRAVFAAYGWNDLAAALVGKPGATTPWPEKLAEQAAAEEELLSRLVALNAERAAEEARGLVRWLRHEFQAAATPAGQQPDAQTEIDVDTDGGDVGLPPTPGKPVAPAGKRAPWPATLPEQICLVADTITQAAHPLDLDQLANHFTGRGPWKKRLPDIVESLAAIGRVKIDRDDERLFMHA